MGSYGQVNTYTFGYSSGTYTPLSGGTAVVPPYSGLTGNGWFEQVYNVPLPFVYYFNGAGYSSVYVNSNGHLAFGSPTTPTNQRPHTLNNGQAGAIMGYGCGVAYQYVGGSGGALLGGLLDNTNANPIYFGTIGTAPNRVFVVQWTSSTRTVTYWGYGGPSDALTFQIRLKESSNVAELVYGSSTTAYSPAYNAVVGLAGASTADFNLVGGSNWTSVSNNTSTSATNIPFTSSVSIPAGTTYDFSPPAGLMPSACSGTPAAATTLATSGIACGPITLSLAALPNATGLTYQWQSSTTGLANSWTNIAGATNATATITPSAAAYYHCLVACGSGTQVASSNLAVGYESSYPGVPSYNYFAASGYPNDNIGQFQIAGGACGTALNDVNNSLSNYNYTGYQTCCGTSYTYVDYTSNATHIQLQGSTSSASTFTATTNNYGGAYAAVVNVWIDFNDNGSFGDAGELVGTVSGVDGSASAFTLTIPANNFGIHRMRVRTASSSLGYASGSLSPTGTLSFFGQANDYMVEILPPTPTPSSGSPVCVNGVLALTSPTITGSTIYTWTGPLSYYSTTTSSTQNYTVTTTSASGTYSLYTTVDGSNACTSSGTTSVTVNPQPSLTSATNSGPICAGNTLTLNANGASNVTGYSWTGPGTITSPASASASVTSAPASASGVYSVAVNNGTGSGCTVTYTTSATVNALPNVSVFSTSAANTCIGNASTVTITSSSLGAGTYTVNYNLTGANSATGNTATLVMGATSGTFNTSGLGSAGGTTVVINTITSGATGCVSNVSAGGISAFTVNSLPSAITGTAVVCAGLTTTLSDAGGGTWLSNNTAIAAVGPTSGIVTGVSGGTAIITYTLPTGCAISTQVTVNQTTPITGIGGTCVGNSITLSDITGGGTWTSNNISVATVVSTTGVVTGVALGTATISYTLPSTGCSATQLVSITTAPPPYIVTGGGSYCAGGTLLHVGLSNSTIGAGYQLYVGGVPAGILISGTGSSIDFGAQPASGIYTVVANPGTSCASTMTGSVTISTLPLPTAYTISGGGGYCAGSAGPHIYLSGSNTGISYQLLNGGGGSGAPVTGTGATLDFGAVTAGGTYSILATNSSTGCNNVMTGSVIVTVNPLPTAYTVTGGGSYCAGGIGLPVGISNSTIGVNYQLYKGGIAVGAPVAGTTSALTFGNQTLAGAYTVVAVNATTGCTSNMTGSVNITIVSLPSLYTVTGGGAFCAGAAGPHVGLSGSATGVSYQLYNGVTPVGGLVSGTGSALDFGSQPAAGVYTVVASVPASACTNSMVGSVTITLNPAPGAFTVTGGGSYCAGTGGVHVGLSGSAIGTSYYCYNGSTAAGGASGTGSAIDFGLISPAGTYTVTATTTATGCSGSMTGSAVIIINPLPSVFTVTGGGSYCAGSPAPHVLLSGSTSGINYSLLNSGAPVGTPSTGAGTSVDFGAQAAAGTYSVFAFNSATGCASVMTGSVVVSVNPLPSAYLVTGGGNYCAGGTGVHVGLGSSNTGISYQLNLAGLPAGSLVAGTALPLDFGLKTTGGTYTITAINTTTLCSNSMTGSVSVGVLPLPNAYAMSGGGNYCAGGSGQHIGLTNSDLGINYQLYNGSASAGSLTGGSGTVIDFGLQTAAGTYTVKATNASSGCISAMTGSEVIGINPLPSVYNITGGGNYCPGGTGVHIGLSSSNTGINYQLYIGTLPLGLATPGTGSSIDFGLQTVAGLYSVMAINPLTGCSNLMSGSVTVSVSSLPAVHNVTGGGGFYCAGGIGVHVGLDGSDAGNTYQLYRGGVLSGSPVAGTGSALDFGLITLGGSYTVVATNTTTGCSNNMLGGAVVTVSGLPPSHTITGGGNYCPGDTGVHIGLNGSDAGINYQLYNGSTVSGSPVAGSGLAMDFGLVTAPGSYTIVATNAITGCMNTMAGSANVGVSALPVVYNATGSGSYCFGGAGLPVLLSGSNTGVMYALYNSGTATTTTVAGTGYPLNFGVQPGGNYTILAISSSTTCTNNMTGTVVITTNPLPGTFSVTGGGYYCAGGSGVDVQLSGSETGVTYQLFAGGTPAGSVVGGNGYLIDFGLQTTAGSYTVVATNSATGCTKNMSGTALVAINSLPVAYSVSGGGAYCSIGSGSDITLGGSVSGINYQLYVGTTATGAPVFGTGSALDFGSYTVAGNYTVKATDPTTGCIGPMSGSVTISILPLPTVYNVTGGGAVCTGSTGVDVSLSGSSTGATYQLVKDGTSTGSPIAGTGAIIDFGLQTTAGSYTVVATNIVSGCTKIMSGTAVVTAGALPSIYTLNSSSTTGYCSGSAGVLVYLASSDPGVSYQLLRGSTSAGAPVFGAGGLLSFGNQTVTGIYTVVATNTSTGCISNMAGGVSVYVNPLPPVYNITGGGGYCSGGSGAHIGITGSSTGVNYQLYHGGLPIGPVVAGTGTALDMGLQTLAGGYTVNAVNPLTGCATNMSGTATITVIPAPVAYIVTGGGNYCAGGTGLHVDLSGSATGVSYQLSFDGSPIGSSMAGTGLPIDFGIHAAGGYYTVSATNTATGCTGSMAGGVIINPVALPTVHNVNGGGGYCAGGAGQVVGLDGSTSGVTYKLYNGSTLIGSPVTGTGFGINFGMQTASGTYTVIGIDGSTTCNSVMAGNAVIIVNPLPDIFPVTGGGSYCAGGSGEHVGLGSSVPGISYSLYYGVLNTGTISGTGAALDFGLQTNAGSYTVVARNLSTSCNNTMSGTAVIDTISVVVPSIIISTGAGDSLCSGVYTTFTALGTNGGASPTYQWTVNGIITGAGMTYSYYPVNGDVVGITYNSNAACAIPAMIVNSATITVLPKEFPGVTVSANPGVEVCRGTSVVLTATPSYGGVAPTYIWKKGTTIVGSGSTLSFIPLAGDVITCKLTSDYLCRLANTAASAPVNMIIDTPSTPVVSIAAYPGLSIAEGETVNFVATVTNAGSAPTYQWSVNSVAITGATSPEYSGNNFGNGELIACDVMSSGACGDVHGGAAVTIHVSNVGVQNINSNPAEMRIIPNPNNGSFVLSGTTGNDDALSVEMTDLIGQVVYRSVVMPKNGVINERVQVGNSVANGMYILNLRSGSDNKVFHVVVER